MRIPVSGVQLPEASLEIEYEGAPILARPGDSLAAAMVDAGVLACRIAASGDMRGVFCGMGICNECVVEVEGGPDSLACMTSVEQGMKVRPHRHGRVGPPAEQTLPERELSPTVLVVGGGPAGLTAAYTAAQGGLDVVLVDERSKLGGQYFKQPAPTRRVAREALDQQFRDGIELIELVYGTASVEVLLHTAVWGAFSSDLLFASSSKERFTFRPEYVILAAGAYEKGLPVPGWTLPGVMTTGAAQTLVRGNQVSPGQRVLVAGNGPLNLQVAAELAASGAQVVSLVELADTRWFTNLRWGAAASLAAPSLARTGLAYLSTLRRRDVPVLDRSVVTRFEGDGRVESVTTARLGRDGLPDDRTTESHSVDAVCVGYGFLPSNTIAKAVGCLHSFDAELGYSVPVRTNTGLTSVEGVWVVGDSGGISGAHVARHQGLLAGVDVVRHATGNDAYEPFGLRAARRALERHERFQAAVRGIYSAPNFTHELADDETVVCRCETVTLGEIRRSLSSGVQSAGALKRATRAGMGKCQGLYCGPVMSVLTADATGRTLDDRSGFAPRPPTRPVAVSIAAATETKDDED